MKLFERKFLVTNARHKLLFFISLFPMLNDASGQGVDLYLSDTTSYNVWCDEMNLPHGSESENMDGDIYINFEEYNNNQKNTMNDQIEGI